MTTKSKLPFHMGQRVKVVPKFETEPSQGIIYEVLFPNPEFSYSIAIQYEDGQFHLEAWFDHSKLELIEDVTEENLKILFRAVDEVDEEEDEE